MNKSQLIDDFIDLAADLLKDYIDDTVEDTLDTVIDESYNTVLAEFDTGNKKDVLRSLSDHIRIAALEKLLEMYKQSFYKKHKK